MSWIFFLLLLTGLITVFLECFLLGGMIGTAGGVFLFTSIILFAVDEHSFFSLCLLIGGLFIWIGLVVVFAIWQNK